jgi:hypothetical protein
VAETTTPLDRLVALLVYAPVGLALTVKDDLGTIVERGRRTVVPQVQVAKFMGRLAVAQVAKAAGDLVDDALSRGGRLPAPPASPTAPTDVVPGPEPSSGNGSGGATVVGGAPDAGQLAIPGYDSLSAAQVVQRLAGLGDGELNAVRSYEVAHRGRRTILCKIEQLQAGRA